MSTRKTHKSGDDDAGAAAVPEPADEPTLLLRPDGYYWVAEDGRQEFGPFATREAAWADMNAGLGGGRGPDETLPDAEQAIGIADWIDPQTGEPAEGPSPPHLDPD